MENVQEGSLLCTPSRVAAVKQVINVDTPVIQSALRTAAGSADAAAELLLRAADAQAGLDEPVRDVPDGDDERRAQATNSTSHVSAVAGNRGQAGQQQSSDPPALAQGQSMSQDEDHSEPHHASQALQQAAKKKRWSAKRAQREREATKAAAALKKEPGHGIAHDCDDGG